MILINHLILSLQLSIAGMWHYRKDGAPVSQYEVKRFQGIASTTKDAKYAAAKKAIEKFKTFMPGIYNCIYSVIYMIVYCYDFRHGL
jgi:hypothetical protein